MRNGSALLLVTLVYVLFLSPFLYAKPIPEWDSFSASTHEPSVSVLGKLHLGGRVKLSGSNTWHKNHTVFDEVGSGTCGDGSIDLRLTSEVSISSELQFGVHYQAVWAGGDSRERSLALKRLFGNILPANFLSTHLDDQRRLFDLTRVIHESPHSILYHRLDRLVLSYVEPWGSIRLGRQAITWGNGLIFNPMDIFNPFPPAAIDRDYKVGDDMVKLEIATGTETNLQLLYIPRRNTNTDAVSFKHSSLAGKMHTLVGPAELDLMLARHYGDNIVGFGGRGYLGQAAWRIDSLYTFQDQGTNYLSLVASIDYSWTWIGKNFYGLVEYFHSGIGKSNYGRAMMQHDIAFRLSRGELFLLGRNYLGGEIRMELHPLINFFFTTITNLHDPSGLLQPRFTWDVTQDWRIVAGLTSEWGDSLSEFGGFPIPQAHLRAPSEQKVFFWLLYYF